MNFPSSRFEGHVPKEIISMGVMRIERVGGATAVTHHPSFDGEPVKRYDIVGGCIQQPERGPRFQFLVVETGCRLVFEGEGPEVFIAGTIASEDGKSLRARDCVGVPAARA
jgi:hypothetical protein